MLCVQHRGLYVVNWFLNIIIILFLRASEGCPVKSSGPLCTDVYITEVQTNKDLWIKYSRDNSSNTQRNPPFVSKILKKWLGPSKWEDALEATTFSGLFYKWSAAAPHRSLDHHGRLHFTCSSVSSRQLWSGLQDGESLSSLYLADYGGPTSSLYFREVRIILYILHLVQRHNSCSCASVKSAKLLLHSQRIWNMYSNSDKCHHIPTTCQ